MIFGLEIGNGRAEVGGGISNDGDLFLTDCLIIGNVAVGNNSDLLSGIGGGIFSRGTLYLLNCTIDENSANGDYKPPEESAIGYAIGGGIYASKIHAWNCTFYGNVAQGGVNVEYGPAAGGGIFIWSSSSVDTTGSSFLKYCTVSGNEAIGWVQPGTDWKTTGAPWGGGGIAVVGALPVLANTIVCGNTADSAPDVQGSVYSEGGNVAGTQDGATGWRGTGDLFGTVTFPLDPLLGPLLYNGGPTPTMALDPASVAARFGVRVNGPMTDQRGLGRPPRNPRGNPLLTGDGTDSGAYEIHVINDQLPYFLFSVGPSLAVPYGATLLSASTTNADTFQWQFGGTNIPGATNSSFLLTNVQPSQAGDYALVLSNSYGSVTGAPATVLMICTVSTSNNPSASGTVLLSPNQSSYVLGSNVTLTAIGTTNNASSAYTFQSWSGSASGTNNPLTVVVTNNMSIVANFILDQNAPYIAPISDATVVEGSLLSLTVRGGVGGSNIVVYSLDSTAPTNATIDLLTGQFLWWPTEDQGPGSYDIVVRAATTNAPFFTAVQRFNISVLESNQPPVLAAISNRTTVAGVPVTFTVSATDPDSPANLLFFSLRYDAPTNATLDPVSGAFSWTPTVGQASSNYTFGVRVTDFNFQALTNSSLSATQFFTITVLSSPPQLSIALAGTNVNLLWRTNIPGFALEQTADTRNWSLVSPGPVLYNGSNLVVVPHTNTARFYRLKK